LQALVRDVPLEDRAQAVVGDEVVRSAEQSAGARYGAQRKNVTPPQAHPDTGQFPHAVVVWPRGHPRRVHGGDRGADQEVRTAVAFEERSEHPDLDGAQASATGEDKSAMTVLLAARLARRLPVHWLPMPPCRGRRASAAARAESRA